MIATIPPPPGYGQTDSSGTSESTLPTGTAAVVLAAGAGERFNTVPHKLLTKINGTPLVRIAVNSALAANFDETIVVMGAIDLLGVLPLEVTVLQNDAWNQGQATSLMAAINYAGSRGHRAVVVGLGDQPGIPTAAWQAVGTADADLAIAEFSDSNGDDLRCPPTKIGAAFWSHLPLTGDEGARGLIRRKGDLVQAVPCEGNPADIDTPEDLALWKSQTPST